MSKLIVGFTGTRFGATRYQLESLDRFMVGRLPNEWHHGGGVGADKQSHDLAIGYGIDIWIHPSLAGVDFTLFPRQRADRLERPYGHLRRNRNIVGAVHVMVACPRGFEEELRSGTWATIRYARKIGRKLYIMYPDGRVDVESNLPFYGDAVPDQVCGK